jgi:hypothetical protein
MKALRSMLVVLVLMTCLVSTAMARVPVNSQWHYIGSNQHGAFYVDDNGIALNPEKKLIAFWTKLENKEGYVISLMRVNCQTTQFQVVEATLFNLAGVMVEQGGSGQWTELVQGSAVWSILSYIVKVKQLR